MSYFRIDDTHLRQWIKGLLERANEVDIDKSSLDVISLVGYARSAGMLISGVKVPKKENDPRT